MISNVAVAAYDTHLELEHDVKTLQHGGFDMTRVCIMGRDYAAAHHVVAFLHSGRRARFFGKRGPLWGTLSGILVGAALVFVPLAGHIVIVGPIASYIVNELNAPTLRRGLSPLAAALTGLGIPDDAALGYEAAIRAQEFLLIVQGDPHGIQHARALLDPAALRIFESS
jgi:uncharacterized protein YqgC (DUF456 family)